MKAEELSKVFIGCIEDYHIMDDVNQSLVNPFDVRDFNQLIYNKCWIDTVQWHYEDLIRDPNINPEDGMSLKKLIDLSNQKRTDIVEKIDDHFLEMFHGAVLDPDATINTESPAWVIDRLSILALKLFHMEEQVNRSDAEEQLIQKSKIRFTVLQEQQVDLQRSFDQLMDDYRSGRKAMKVYRQMKLYNDPATNPVFYNK